MKISAQRIIISFAVTFLALVCLSGCASWNSHPDTSTPLTPNTIARFNDVPVPAGFKLRNEDSYAFENYGTRVAMLRYTGKADIDQTANFFKSQMPGHNWRLLNSLEYGQRLLNFETDDETCIINLIPKGSTVIITVSLGPKSSNAVKKQTKPLR